MTNTVWRNFALPLVVISALLFGLGVAAAWNVQRQHVTTSEVIAREVKSILVMQDLYISMREIRRYLDLYLRSGERRHLTEAVELTHGADATLAAAKDLVRTPEEQNRVEAVVAGHAHFSKLLDQVAELPSGAEQEQTIADLGDRLLTEEVLSPALECVKFNHLVVDRTNEANRQTTNKMREGFLLLGVAGGGAGIIGGIVIARGMQQRILQLQVSVRGAAGKLSQVVDPIAIGPMVASNSLLSGLREFERHVTDVVERLQQRELEVLRSEQLAAVGQLAAGMAHELRNPLMPMKLLVQGAIQRREGLHGHDLLVIEEEISRLESSIQGFLDFAKPPQLHPTAFDLRQMIHATVELVSGRAASQQVSLSAHVPEYECRVTADATQVRQILLNLLLNSLDELKQGGRIDVSLTRDPAAETQHTGDSDELEFCWILSVRDDGPGFEPEMLSRAFEPFVSSKETGTGLGLCICRRIAEAHGGSIVARNAESGGAEFEVCLPAKSQLTPPEGSTT